MWGRMDDKFHRNRKVRELRQRKGGMEALGAWTFWWSWCLDDPELTGVVPSCELSRNDERSAELLADVGLWERVDGGYRFHDFGEYNPSRGQIEEKRRADRERVAAKRNASRASVARDNDATSMRLASDSQTSRASVADESHESPARVASTRDPDPSRPNSPCSPPEPLAEPSLPLEPTRFRQPLEDAVRAEFFARGVTPQKAASGQWRDGCQTVQDALTLGKFQTAHEAIGDFSRRLVEACARGEKLGFALQQTQLTSQRSDPDFPEHKRIRIARKPESEVAP